jgi:hypothetical protein
MAEARGFIGGLVGGALVSGLMRIRPPPPAISSSLEQIAQQSVPAGGSVTLKPATLYKFAIVAFHGNGDPQITITVQKGASSATIAGNEQGFEFVANESLQITAQNTDTASARNTPTIEILSLSF